MVFQSMCMLCLCLSVHLSVPFIRFVYVFICRTLLLMYQFESWITCVCSPYDYFLHIMWSGSNLQLLYILPFGMLCLSAISMMFVKILLAVCMLVGMVV